MREEMLKSIIGVKEDGIPLKLGGEDAVERQNRKDGLDQEFK